MATFRSLPLLLLASLALLSTISISQATFTSFGKNASFVSDDIALYGDAKILDGGSSISIHLNDSASHGGGRVVYKKPIMFVETKSSYPGAFSTVLAFSISPNERLGLVVFPVNGTFDQSFFQVKFETSKNFGKLGKSNVTVIVNGTTVSKKIRKFAVANLNKEKGLLLYAMINYIASGKFIEVRLSETESFENVDPLMFTWIDLSRMMKDDDEFMVGLKSYSGDVTLSYWSLEASRVPKALHSNLQSDLAIYLTKLKEEEEAKKRRRGKVWGIVTCFVMTFGSTGIVFFAMMHIWAALKRNNLVMARQEECGIKTKEFEYAKMGKTEADTKQEKK